MSLICECHELDEAKIISLVKQGFDTTEKLKEETGAGCCGCMDDLDELIDANKV